MTARRLTALAALLIAAGLVVAQPAPKKDAPPKGPPKPAPGSLEDTLEKALRNSADIKAAEAKVRESEAALNLVRQQVLTRATALHADLNQAKRMLALAEQIFARKKSGTERGITPPEAAMTAQTAVEKHRGEVEKLETELKSLRGEFALKLPGVGMTFDPTGQRITGTGPDGTIHLSKDAIWADLTLDFTNFHRPAPAVPSPMFDRVKKLLDQEVAYEVPSLPMAVALRNLLAEAKSDIPIRALLPAPTAEGRETRIELQPGKLPVGAWIQAIEDTDDEVAVVVRDYGLLLTMKNRVPAGAVRVADLWKAKSAKPEVDPKEKK